MMIRTRFSPSPTGNLHLGGVRTTLFSALYAKQHDGVFILRIEDTDVVRSEEKYAKAQQEDLRWLGIHWQEGPGVNGPYGPYWQSQRHDIYHAYYLILEQEKLIYPCFCTNQELMMARKLQLSRSEAPRYSGKCRNLSQDAIQQKRAAGLVPSWRFALPSDQVVCFNDLVKGEQQFHTHDMGDFIIRRADGTAPFLFGNAIDDAVMRVSHVLRGEDHLSNTPRQILILKALGLHVPHYGHLSLITGSDGAKLSKRHGDFSVHEIREQGFLPQAILNYLARLGHSIDAAGLLSFDELAACFQLDKLSRSPARFDAAQLMYWQKLAVQALSCDEFWHWLGERVGKQVPENDKALFADTIKMNISLPDEALLWAKILYHERAEMTDEGRHIIHQAGEQFFVEAEQAVEKYGIALNEVLAEMKTTLNVQGKKLFMPLRIALTGQEHGPELIQIARLLGKEKLKHRLSHAFALAKEGQ